MKEITITKAERHELDWINSKYKEVDFVASNFDTEFIVIAKIENQNAGLGRLVVIDNENIELGGIYVFSNFRGMKVAESIVDFLCTKNPYKNTIIWCLPFENLLSFYEKFGFKKPININIPNEILKKLEWCNGNENYGKKVMLLHKKE